MSWTLPGVAASLRLEIKNTLAAGMGPLPSETLCALNLARTLMLACRQGLALCSVLGVRDTVPSVPAGANARFAAVSRELAAGCYGTRTPVQGSSGRRRKVGDPFCVQIPREGELHLPTSTWLLYCRSVPVRSSRSNG